MGAIVERDGPAQRIRARHGVILGSGGFEKNLEMREKYQPRPTSIDWTTGAPSNEGDGILAGIAAGADIALMDDAWWGPTIPLPRGAWFCLAERNLPGSIMVNAAGRRFMNEALPYVEAVHEIYKGEATGVQHVPVLDDPRPALPQPLPLRRPRAATAVPRPLVQARHPVQGRLARGAGRADRRSRRVPSPRPSSASTASRARVSTRTSTAVTAPTTSTTPTRPSSRTRRCTPSTRARSTRSRSSRATSAPRAAWSPTSTPACCGTTAR